MNVAPPNFIADGRIYLVRCPECNRENYTIAVATGQCAWCGYNANRVAESRNQLEDLRDE